MYENGVPVLLDLTLKEEHLKKIFYLLVGR
jgi:hypothetical protein